ncbi:LolA-like protein [Peterkaempfera bronchialis]|uniref:Lipoprotein n=1 Tax=Peterkaempfera bronchialis TaxID=2126346 RepID=A0A345SWG8_9ACTN|nr:hypothetical protein [Peterkaempfera bronchialis]AXI78073.1 hypothetical protein C7M71_012090 [Peterkaempfera bronchialis]
MQQRRLRAAGTVAVLAAAACSPAAGAGSPKTAEPAPAAVLDLVGRNAAAAGTARVSMTMRIPGISGAFTVDGVMGWGDQIGMDIQYGGNEAMKGLDPDGSVHAVAKGATIYYELHGPAISRFGGKHWMRMDLSAGTGAQGGGATEAQLYQDPSAVAKALTASGDLREVGKETVAAAETTRYSGSVPVAKLVAAGSGLTAQQRKRLLRALQAAGIGDTAVDLWVDAEQLPVRVVRTTPTEQGTMTVTTDFADYGTPLKVTVPPASDTADLVDLMKKLKAQG